MDLCNYHQERPQIAIYVKRFSEDIHKLRNDCLVYVDGQNYAACRDRKLPLIVSSKRDNKCTHHIVHYNKI